MIRTTPFAGFHTRIADRETAPGGEAAPDGDAAPDFGNLLKVGEIMKTILPAVAEMRKVYG